MLYFIKCVRWDVPPEGFRWVGIIVETCMVDVQVVHIKDVVFYKVREMGRTSWGVWVSWHQC